MFYNLQFFQIGHFFTQTYVRCFHTILISLVLLGLTIIMTFADIIESGEHGYTPRQSP